MAFLYSVPHACGSAAGMVGLLAMVLCVVAWIIGAAGRWKIARTLGTAALAAAFVSLGASVLGLLATEAFTRLFAWHTVRRQLRFGFAFLLFEGLRAWLPAFFSLGVRVVAEQRLANEPHLARAVLRAGATIGSGALVGLLASLGLAVVLSAFRIGALDATVLLAITPNISDAFERARMLGGTIAMGMNTAAISSLLAVPAGAYWLLRRRRRRA